MNGDRLRELRTRKALAMRELSERAGVNLQTIYRLENGRQGAHPRTVRKLAGALGVEPEELVGDAR